MLKDRTFNGALDTGLYVLTTQKVSYMPVCFLGTPCYKELFASLEHKSETNDYMQMFVVAPCLVVLSLLRNSMLVFESVNSLCDDT